MKDTTLTKAELHQRIADLEAQVAGQARIEAQRDQFAAESAAKDAQIAAWQQRISGALVDASCVPVPATDDLEGVVGAIGAMGAQIAALRKECDERLSGALATALRGEIRAQREQIAALREALADALDGKPVRNADELIGDTPLKSVNGSAERVAKVAGLDLVTLLVDASFALSKAAPGSVLVGTLERAATKLREANKTDEWHAANPPHDSGDGPVQFQIWDDEDFFAQVDGPREMAWQEALTYAAQCKTPIIEEVTRRVMPLPERLHGPRQVGPGLFEGCAKCGNMHCECP